MRIPQYDMTIFDERRKILTQKIKGSTLVLAAHPEMIRNGDVHHAYRQDSSFFYLTGFEEANAIFVFRPGHTPETVMFVQPRDPGMETWTGFRYGPENAKKYFRIEQTYTISQINEELPKLLKDTDKVYYSLFVNREVDATLLRIINEISLARSRTNKGNLTIEDSRPLIGEMRIKKTQQELMQLKKACDISAAAHVEVMRSVKPGVNERALHGVFLKAIMERGCAREGYGSIVATGVNATTLHYVFNDQVCRDGDMILVDAGGEFNYFTGDITRTYPVNGKFNTTQKRVYQKILNLQKNLIAAVKPGMTREGLQKEAIDGLTEIMLEEKLLIGKKETLIENKDYFKFYPHGVGHW
ncbi:MAG: Xaa-Pro aminopeptidase, partial [Bdellovibrionales bacterium RBG_16_40_8]